MKRNYALLREVYNIIETEPHRHDQRYWGRRTQCGTTHCVAGHVVALTGAAVDWTSDDSPDAVFLSESVIPPGGQERQYIASYAGDQLGLTPAEANELFLDTDTREDVLLLLKHYLNEEGGEGNGVSAFGVDAGLHVAQAEAEQAGDDGGDT